MKKVFFKKLWVLLAAFVLAGSFTSCSSDGGSGGGSGENEPFYVDYYTGYTFYGSKKFTAADLEGTGAAEGKYDVMKVVFGSDSKATVTFYEDEQDYSGTYVVSDKKATVTVPYTDDAGNNLTYTFTTSDYNGGFTATVSSYGELSFSRTAGKKITYAAKTEFTITYNANYVKDGADSAETVTQTFTYGQNVTLDGNTLKKDGYVFAGWGTTAGTSYAEFTDGQTIKTTDSAYSKYFIMDVTLYAVWKPETLKITYKANYSGATAEDVIQEIDAATDLDSEGKIKLKANSFTRNDGYIFWGWATYAGSNYVYYEDEESASISYNQTLYAIWHEPNYTITFKPSYGTESAVTQKIPITKKETVKATLTANTFSYSGYVFWGWDECDYASSYALPEYINNEEISLSEDLTLHAVWISESSAIQITYNANDGSENPETKIQYLKKNTSSLYNRLEANTFVRENYEFKGWATSKSSESVQYSDKEGCATSSNTTLYAVWEYTGPVTIIYNGNGGTLSDGSSSYSDSNLTPGSTVTLLANEFTRSGSTFAGWDIKAAASSVQYEASEAITVPSKEVLNLYAVWKDDITVTLNSNNGSGETIVKTVSYDLTDKYKFTFPETAGFTYDSKLFAGWSTSSTVSSAAYSAGETIKLTGSTTYFAVWVDPTTISISVSVPAVTSYTDVTVTYDEENHCLKASLIGYPVFEWVVDGGIEDDTSVAGDTFNIYLLPAGTHTVTVAAKKGNVIYSASVVVNIERK